MRGKTSTYIHSQATDAQPIKKYRHTLKYQEHERQR